MSCEVPLWKKVNPLLVIWDARPKYRNFGSTAFYRPNTSIEKRNWKRKCRNRVFLAIILGFWFATFEFNQRRPYLSALLSKQTHCQQN